MNRHNRAGTKKKKKKWTPYSIEAYTVNQYRSIPMMHL